MDEDGHEGQVRHRQTPPTKPPGRTICTGQSKNMESQRTLSQSIQVKLG